ncbi:MAG: hypothetical protein ACOY93_14285 [Bacillota bacterium]
MRGAIKGFLVTAVIWVFLLLAYVGIEAVRGNGLKMFTWEPGGKYVTITVALVLALGTAVGLASDRIQKSRHR